MAKEGIRLESMTGIAMQGMSDIMALYSEGASSFCVNGSVDMLGRLAGIQNKLRSIFANNDAAMRETLGMGNNSIIRIDTAVKPQWINQTTGELTVFH